VDAKDLIQRMAEGEGVFQEFKSSMEHIDRSLTAFANAKGGVLYLGVNDNGKMTGFKWNNRSRARVTDIARNIDPGLKVDGIDLGGCVAIVVPEGSDKPYHCADGFFLRIGATNQKLSRNEIMDLAVRVNRLRFESLPDGNFKYPKDFSAVRHQSFVNQAGLGAVARSMGREALLVSLGAAKPLKKSVEMNYAGTLFFAKHPQQSLPQAKISYARYQGADKTHVIDRAIFSGSLAEQLDQCMRKLNADIPVGYRLADTHARVDLTYFPVRALEEALINALIHRDYCEEGAEIMLDYFADRIEICNPGELIGSLTLEQLGRRSLRRNPAIAELFFRIGRGEKLGSGIARMNALMAEWKLKAPVFQSAAGFFTVTFIGPQRPAAEHKLLALPERPREFASERNLAPRDFSASFYANRFNVTTRTAQKDLALLMHRKIIARSGEGKSTRYWFV
jgi:ATP-dependent DNA helicase RecG